MATPGVDTLSLTLFRHYPRCCYHCSPQTLDGSSSVSFWCYSLLRHSDLHPLSFHRQHLQGRQTLISWTEKGQRRPLHSPKGVGIIILAQWPH